MSGSELSVQLYTIREALVADLPGALTRLAALGFKHVELFDFVERADELAAELTKQGLDAPSGHAMLVGEDVTRVFDAAQTLGMRTVIQPMIPAERWASDEDIESSARALNAIAEVAARRDLRVGYHNHWWEFERIEAGPTALERFTSHLDDDVVMELDTYWAQTAGVDPVELISRLGDRVQFLHIKDGPATLATDQQVAVGSGVLDVPAITRAAPHALRVVELDDFSGDVFEALRDSVAYLNGLEARR